MENNKHFNRKKIIPPIITIALGMMLVMMDTTIMNVALPHIQAAFHTNLQVSQWSITAYTLSMATVIPFAGYLSDRFSANKIFTIAIFLFIITSGLVSLSQNIDQLIIYRVLQGISGGLIGPVGIAMSFNIIPIEKRGSMMSILGLPMLLAPILGPSLSGLLLKHFNWNTIFLINIPVGLLSLILSIKLLPNFDKNNHTKLDKFGAILAPFAFPILIFAVSQGTKNGWNNILTLALLILGLAILITFIIFEVHATNPLLQFKAFKYSEFRKGVSLMWLNQTAVFGSMLLIPLFLQNVLGFSSLSAGLMMTSQAVFSFIGMTIGGKIFDKYGTKYAVFPGLIFMGGSLLLLSRINMTTTVFYFIFSIVLLGLGQGLVNMQVNNHALKSVPLTMINRVTPMTNVMLQVVNSFSIAFLTAFLTSHMNNEKIKSISDRAINAYHRTFLLLLCFVSVSLVICYFIKDSKVKKENSYK